MALTTAEVTTVSRNSGTRRTREDTDGHDHRANQVQQDTGGPAGILKDTSLRRFGTVRPRVQIPGPRPISDSKTLQPQSLTTTARCTPRLWRRFATSPRSP